MTDTVRFPGVEEDEVWEEEEEVSPATGTLSIDDLDFIVPLKTIPADDMPVVIGRVRDAAGNVIDEGETIYPHKGQTVTILPVFGMSFVIPAGELAAGASGGMTSFTRALYDLSEEMSLIVVDWDLTDLARQLRPKPYKNPKAIARLSEEEFGWLLAKCQGSESQADRKNGSRPSRSSSAAKGRRR